MTDALKVAVLGGGGNAQAIAADFSLTGCEVNLYNLPTYAHTIEHLIETRQIEKLGSKGTTCRTGVATLNQVTTDMAEAIRGVDLIVISTPAYGHSDFFDLLAPELDDGQTIILIPGNWGALRLRNLLKERGIKKKVQIAETDRCMQICRASEHFLGPGKVRVIIERDVLMLAAIPSSDTDDVIKVLKPLYPRLSRGANVIETSLNNPNLVIHGPLMIMNAGWLEHTAGQFMIYRDGATPAVGQVTDDLIRERDQVLAAMDFETNPVAPFYEQIKAADWVHDPCEVGPPTMQHRYLSEDIPYGLVPLSSFGDLLQVETPVSDAVVQIAASVNQDDYWSTGLTVENLGLSGLSPGEVKSKIDKGV